jgi:hypothetical protein
MMNASERNKLMDDFKDEPLYALALVLRCGAGLLIIALVAFIGIQTGLEDSESRYVPTTRHESPSISHSRALYEQRRAQFLKENRADLDASPNPEPAATATGSYVGIQVKSSTARTIEP